MSKKDRQHTPAEQKRKEDFEIICEAMEKKGYSKFLQRNIFIPLNSE